MKPLFARAYLIILASIPNIRFTPAIDSPREKNAEARARGVALSGTVPTGICNEAPSQLLVTVVASSPWV